MTSEYLNSVEDEDVVIEGSELHQVLTKLGYTNFYSTPKAEIDFDPWDIERQPNHESWSKCLNNKLNFFYHYLNKDNSLRIEQLKTILEANVLLDDHAAALYELLGDHNSSKSRKVLEWFSTIGSSAAIFALIMKKKSISHTIGALTIFGTSVYMKLNHWHAIKNLKQFVNLQNELHNLCKQTLKILRRTYKKSIISDKHEKNEMIGNEKYRILLEMKNLLVVMFENLSRFYYFQAIKILSVIPNSLYLTCILTPIEFKNEEIQEEINYDRLKNLYYTYILVQSETMFMLAHAYNGKAFDTYFKIQKSTLLQIIKKLNTALSVYHSKLSSIIHNYEMCEIQPVRLVFRGIPSSKWQDTYIHLDLTSHRIQLAYKEITSILELIDAHSEKDEDKLVQLITEKMNEAYKQIENARSFAEFSSLLIAKAQRKAVTNAEQDNESLFPANDDNKKVVIIDIDPEIEDEVFEEYIKEEYLRPLIENSDGSAIEDFKLDKLLKKNFMNELKEALIDKQKSMTERELKALKRMYKRMQKDSGLDKSELEKVVDNVSATPTSAPPPSPPPLPQLTLENRIVAENHLEYEEEPKKGRTPVPLPRVKMLQLEDDMPYVQKFSISECTPNFKFPPFKAAEETFLGSGENSEEELDADGSNSEDEKAVKN